jgi:hypothetical protein
LDLHLRRKDRRERFLELQMTPTRLRVQLQQGLTNLDSVLNTRAGLTFLEIAMAVRTLHANTRDQFPKKIDQMAYDRAATKLVTTLEQAMQGRFEPRTAGNQFREEFWATRNGKRALYRIDVEVKGPIAAA